MGEGNTAEPMPPYEQLTARLVGIGFNLAAEPEVDAEIESTLGLAGGARFRSLRAGGPPEPPPPSGRVDLGR